MLDSSSVEVCFRVPFKSVLQSRLKCYAVMSPSRRHYQLFIQPQLLNDGVHVLTAALWKESDWKNLTVQVFIMSFQAQVRSLLGTMEVFILVMKFPSWLHLAAKAVPSSQACSSQDAQPLWRRLLPQAVCACFPSLSDCSWWWLQTTQCAAFSFMAIGPMGCTNSVLTSSSFNRLHLLELFLF